MADDKYAKSKCFILSPDGYEEITYSELCRQARYGYPLPRKKIRPASRNADGGDAGAICRFLPHKEQTAVFGQTVGRKRRYLHRYADHSRF